MSLWIEKTVMPRGSQFGITRRSLVMPNSDPRDGFVYSFLKLMFDSFSCIFLGVKA